MSEYDQILKQNSFVKKQLAVCQLKIQSLKGENQQITYDNDNLKSINAKQLKQNEQLKAEIQSLNRDKKQLRDGYQRTINQIKIQIDNKQQQLQNIENRVSPSYDYAIMRMKIVHQLEAQYQPKLEFKQGEVIEIKNKYNDAVRQIELLQQKLRLKQRSTNNIIQQMRQNHLIQIQNITKTIVQLNKQEDNPTKQINKKLKREVAQLRQRLIFKDKQLEDLYQEKMNLKERMNEITISLNESALKSKQQSKIVRNQYDNMARIVSDYEQKRERDRVLGSEKDRQIKKLKDRVQELQEELEKKQKLIKKHQQIIDDADIQLQKLKNQLSNQNDKMNHEILKNTINVLQKDHQTLRIKFQQLKKQNKDLKDRQKQDRREAQNLNSQLNKIKQGIPTTQNNNQDIEAALKKQGGAYQKIINVLKKQIDKVNQQKNKAQQKTEKNKNLLKQANNKIMELIQSKIVSHQSQSPQPRQIMIPVSLPSPTPTVKKVFQFQSEGRFHQSPNQTRFNPEVRINQPQIHNEFYTSQKSLNRSKSPLQPIYRIQERAYKTHASHQGQAGKSSFQFYEMAKRIQPRKVSPACGHKHH